jgi:uncharacterized protein
MKVAVLIILSLIFCICSPKQQSTFHPVGKSDSTKTYILTESQKKILDGAKKCLAEKFSYDMKMAYHVLKYKNGENTGSFVYPGGDLEPALGVCVEVTIRALRYAGIVDLQEAIHEDLKKNYADYPMSRWGSKPPDANIDHRRVPNQLAWLKKNWTEVNENECMPGDIVIWDMDGDSWGDHIGIVSDKSDGGKLFVIHNFPSPGYVAEEDVMNRWGILGVFRVK